MDTGAAEKNVTDTGALLVLDEIQTGFGRTGSLWGFEQYGMVPGYRFTWKSTRGRTSAGRFYRFQNADGCLYQSARAGSYQYVRWSSAELRSGSCCDESFVGMKI